MANSTFHSCQTKSSSIILPLIIIIFKKILVVQNKLFKVLREVCKMSTHYSALNLPFINLEIYLLVLALFRLHLTFTNFFICHWFGPYQWIIHDNFYSFILLTASLNDLYMFMCVKLFSKNWWKGMSWEGNRNNQSK